MNYQTPHIMRENFKWTNQTFALPISTSSFRLIYQKMYILGYYIAEHVAEQS